MWSRPLACSEGNLLKKKLLAVLTTGAFIVSFGGFDHENTAYGQAPPKGALPGQMSESAFKNVTVLKGIPVDEFMGTMGLFAAALSFCCKDCHTGAGTANPKWEDDPPRKVTARRMIQMVNNINQQNFNGRQVVTCWTCHRGSTSPAITPPIDTVYGDTDFHSDRRLARSERSDGGNPSSRSDPRQVHSGSGRGRRARQTHQLYRQGNQPFVWRSPGGSGGDLRESAESARDTLVHQREGDLARTYDGREAWVMLPLTVVGQYPLNASALEGAKLDAQLAFPAGSSSSSPTGASVTRAWSTGVPST